MNLSRYGAFRFVGQILVSAHVDEETGESWVTRGQKIHAKETVASMTEEEARKIESFLERFLVDAREYLGQSSKEAFLAYEEAIVEIHGLSLLLVAWGRRGSTEAHDRAFRKGSEGIRKMGEIERLALVA